MNLFFILFVAFILLVILIIMTSAKELTLYKSKESALNDLGVIKRKIQAAILTSFELPYKGKKKELTDDDGNDICAFYGDEKEFMEGVAMLIDQKIPFILDTEYYVTYWHDFIIIREYKVINDKDIFNLVKLTTETQRKSVEYIKLMSAI